MLSENEKKGRQNHRSSAHRRPRQSPAWLPESGLIQPLTPEAIRALELLPKVLAQICPLSPAHRHELPNSIASLSRVLTCERSELRHPYWHTPAHTAAYLYYFLPWNLVRLTRLLAGLSMEPPAPINGSLPLLLDAGSGPMTLPLALWLAKPEWRELPLTVFALDAARRPLLLGKSLLTALSELEGMRPWSINIATGPIHNLAKANPGASSHNYYPWLASAANALNELRATPRKHAAGFSDPNRNQAMEDILNAWTPLWTGGAQLLFVEPGTRLGGTNIMRMREAALETGLQPLAPCTHDRSCPLLLPAKAGRHSSSWCHFVFSAQDAPSWLKNLSSEAGLFKTSLTISALLLRMGPPRSFRPGGALPCRVISRSFSTPFGESRYGCAAPGLCLLPNSARAASGSLCLAKNPDGHTRRDAKSSALILKPYTDCVV